MMTYANLGEKSKPDQDEEEQSPSDSPLETKRTHTDVLFLAGFSIYAAFWFFTGIYVFAVDDTIEIRYSNVLHHDEIFLLSDFIAENISEAKWLILAFVTLSVLLLVGFIAMFRWFTKLLVYITVFLVSAGLLLIYVLLCYRAYKNMVVRGYASLTRLIIMTVIVVLYGMTMRAFRNIGTEPVCKVIRLSCKAMFFFPSALVLTLLQFGLHFLVIGFSVAVFLLLRTIKMPDNLDKLNMTAIEADFDEMWNEEEPPTQIIDIGLAPNRVIIFHLINIVGVLWIFNFFAGLGRMILTATFATWYYTEDKRRVPSNTLRQCINAIVTYHLGTVAFGASLFTIFPMLYIIFRHGRDKLKEMCRNPSCALSWLTVLAKFSFDALAICAVHGDNFYRSAKDSYILLMKNPLSFLTINFISECVTFIGLLLLPIASFFATMTYVCLNGGCENRLHSVHVTLMLVVTVTSALMSLTFFSVFRAASNTIRYCYLQDSKFSQESEMNMYEIHVEETYKMNDDRY